MKLSLTSKLPLISLPLILVLITSPEVVSESKQKIGISTALTGSSAPTGTDIQNAALFANDFLTGGRYELIVEDDQCTGRGATTAAQKLTRIDGVAATMGFACSSTILTSAPIYQRAKTVAMSSSAASSDISKLGEYIFRTWPGDSLTVSVLLDAIKERHDSVAVLSEESEYCERLLQEFRPNAETRSLEVRSVSFLPAETDLRTLLLRLGPQEDEAIFINAQSERSFLSALRQIRELGMNHQIYGLYWPGSSSFLEEAGPLAEGILFVDAPADETFTAEGREIFKRFTEEYGQPNYTPMLFATTFEAFRVLDLALSSGKDPETYLTEETFSGIFGPFSFDSNGDIEGVPMLLKSIRDGSVVNLTEF